MANSFVLYEGDGAQTDYSVPFGYLDASHISVSVDDVDSTFTFLTSNTIQMDSAPADGASVKVFRTTPTALQVTIPAAGVFRGDDINNQTLQALYLTEESVDALGSTLSEDDSGHLDADSRKIKNLTDPTEDQDAATKAYVDSTTASDVAAAAASAATAETHKDSAASSASSASSSASAAAASYDSFDDRYLGAKASDPSVDNDGGSLLTGAMYFNTALNVMKAYNGASWQVSYNPATAGVDSFNSRTGVVSPAASDYDASQIDNDSNVPGDFVDDALNNLYIKHNFTANGAPTTGDDDGDGYSVGSKWYDVTGDESYVCLDSTTSAAVWLNTTLTIDDLGDLAVADDADGVGFTSGSGLSATDVAAALDELADEKAVLSQTWEFSGLIVDPEEKDYTLKLKIGYGFTITETTTISASGTCTATFKIGSTPLGGTANSVSDSESSQAHASANVMVAGDDLIVTISSNSSCADLAFTIKGTRSLS